MDLTALSAVSPIHGRYRNKISELAPFFSEFGLIKYRVWVEIEYFIALCEIPLPQIKDFDKKLYPKLRAIYKDFSISDAQKIKETETITNHDVKAIEYFIKEKFDDLALQGYKEFIHFGVTSQDINNTAIPLSLKKAVIEVLNPILEQVMSKIAALSQRWADIPMLARTHGQPASPTRLGKELAVFQYRLEKQIKQIKQIPFAAKFGGATGNFNAHLVAYPNINWLDFANNFVNETLGLERSQLTTQIENYDDLNN